MCRPVSGSRKEACRGGHTGPPLHEVGRCSGTNGNRRDTTPFLVKGGAGWCVRRRGVVTPPYGCATGDAKQRADVGIGPYASRGDEGRHAGSSCPTGGCGEPPRLPWPAAHSGAFVPAGARKRVGIAAEIIPKVSSDLGQSLSHGEAVTAPFTQGSLWGRGDTDCRVASLLAMTVLILCHSEEAQRADVGIRPFSDGRGFGLPYLGHGLRRSNFLPKFGASVRSSAPTESPINHPSQPARSEASAPAAARDGRESAQRPSQKGDRRRDRPGSA